MSRGSCISTGGGILLALTEQLNYEINNQLLSTPHCENALILKSGDPFPSSICSPTSAVVHSISLPNNGERPRLQALQYLSIMVKIDTERKLKKFSK